ncbi:MAG: hypothetical protein HY820_42625 [Acidobacteria bacterium]|nr:hypothetical protein [Acidobacteriota bacterium]
MSAGPAASKEKFEPFGAPDGSRASINVGWFVSYGDPARWRGLASREDDLTARVFVGKKGSGKTIYLRRLQAWSSHHEQRSLFATQVEQEPPSTEQIVRFGQWFQRTGVLTEKWSSLWRRAIQRSLASHILRNHALRDYTTQAFRDSLAADFKPILRPFVSHVSIYSQVQELISSHYSPKSMAAYLDHPMWADFESILRDKLHDLPTICYFLDAVDDSFNNAPNHWLRCQEGLFDQVRKLLQDSRIGSRLHVMVCLRDLVLAAVYKGEHATRVRNDPHVRVLNWGPEAIEYFLEQKLSQLPPELFLRSAEAQTVENWLGIQEIENSRRNILEPIKRYLIRHTRMLPRDIVQMGNELCFLVVRIKNEGDSGQLAREIRRVVSVNAKLFGDEQITICANELTASSMPANASKHGYSEIYTGDVEYVRGVAGDLKDLIGKVGKDRFTASEMRDAQQRCGEKFHAGADPFSILWRNGLLGYVDELRDGDEIFYSENYPHYHLPLGHKQYVFHPIVIDSVSIAADGPKPVVPRY